MQILPTLASSNQGGPGDKDRNKLIRRYQNAALAVSVLLVLMLVCDIIGWMFDIAALKRPFELRPELEPSCAVTLLLTLISLLVLNLTKVSGLMASLTARLFVFIATGAALANLLEFACGGDFNLVQTIWDPKTGSLGLRFPGPMAPDSALFLVLLGLSVLFYGVSVKGKYWPYQYLAALVAVPNLMVVGSFLFRQEATVLPVCAYFGCLKLSPITSTLLTFSALVVLFVRPERGMTRIYVADSGGGRLMRSMLPGLVALLPLIILVRRGGAGGLYDKPVETGISFLLTIGVLAFCIGLGAKKIDKVEETNTQLLRENESLSSYAGAKVPMKAICLTCASEFDDTTLQVCPNDGSPLHLVEERLKIGAVFADKYKIEKMLGSGGISTVYLAHHLLLDKLVALKMLHTHFASEARYVQRFQREAKAMSHMSHPNVVGVYDFGISIHGQAYLVMDYLEGQSLGELTDEHGPLSWREAVPIFLDIGEGLRHAHAQKIIHRDLKPANVMLIKHPVKGRIAKIVDFGLAKGTDLSSRLTQTGDIMGSPAYMSPEQARGGEVDERSDIYSLGALMYECLVGRPPIMGATIYETLLLHATRAPEPFPDDIEVPPWLKRCVFKSLEKQVQDRQHSVEELLSELQAGIARTLLGTADDGGALKSSDVPK